MKTKSEIQKSGLKNRSEQLSGQMNSQSFLPGMENLIKPFKFPASPYEFKVTALREFPTPESLQLCDTPDKAVEYWRLHLVSVLYFESIPGVLAG